MAPESSVEPVIRSQAERRVQRQQVADAVRKGETVETVAQRFGITIKHVHNACRENGVKFPGQRSNSAAHPAVKPVASAKSTPIKSTVEVSRGSLPLKKLKRAKSPSRMTRVAR